MPRTLTKRTAIIRGRIDPKRKSVVDAIFKRIGLTHTEALNLFYAQVEINEGLPFSVNARPHLTLKNASLREIEERYKEKIPNEQTLEAIKEVENPHKLKSYRNIQQILEDEE